MNKIICLALYKGIFILFHRGEKKVALQKSTTEKPISRLSVSLSSLCPFKQLWLPVWEDLWVLWPSCTQGACVTNRVTSCLGSKGYSGHYSIAIGPCLDLSLALWLHHPGEEEKREKKKNSLHSSVNVHLKLQLNQSLVRINRERLGRVVVERGAGQRDEEKKGVSKDAWWKTGITVQYRRMDFVILKRAVRG